MENSINIPDSLPAPNRHSKVTLQTQKLFSCPNNQEPPLSLLRVDPRVGDDPERMGVEFFLSEEGGWGREKQLLGRLFARRPPKANWQLLSWEGIVSSCHLPASLPCLTTH